jgi:selenocysteine lyase/cysteine desulfurase
LESKLNDLKPVVFIGPYEHHSNEVMWREGLCEVVTTSLTSDGYFDLEDLEKKVSDPRYAKRRKIGSFSAASNVSGIKSPIYEIARIMHENGGIACLDFAAAAPYVKIDMNKDSQSFIDAICISPHKFAGGPGSSGILVINNRLYNSALSPTCAGGGTVDYVNSLVADYVNDIETREKAGTPGILQTIKAALAIDLKDAIGIEKIEEKELHYITRALNRLVTHKNIEILGPIDPSNRISIVSFKIRHGDKYLHPKLITRLLNDLFGIQSRAGCMCAGPYGHFLLNITDKQSVFLRKLISQNKNGMKIGWCRVNFHYLHSEVEFQFICQAIEFIADRGYKFIPEYVFDFQTGEWNHREFKIMQQVETPSIKNIMGMDLRECFSEKLIDHEQEFKKYLNDATHIASSLEIPSNYGKFENKEMEEFKWFNFIHIEKAN